MHTPTRARRPAPSPKPSLLFTAVIAGLLATTASQAQTRQEGSAADMQSEIDRGLQWHRLTGSSWRWSLRQTEHTVPGRITQASGPHIAHEAAPAIAAAVTPAAYIREPRNPATPP